MQLSSLVSSHEEDTDSRGLLSMDFIEIQLHECRAPVHAQTRSCMSISCNKSEPSAFGEEETLRRGGSGHGGAYEGRRHLTASWRWRDNKYAIRAWLARRNPSLNELLVQHTHETTAYGAILPAVAARACGGRVSHAELAGIRLCVLCGRKHSSAGDSGRGHFQATVCRDRASSHNLRI
jgi:hypothetical protein